MFRFLFTIDSFLWHQIGQDFQCPWILGSVGEHVLAKAKLQWEQEERASWVGSSKRQEAWLGLWSLGVRGWGSASFPLIGQCGWWRLDLRRNIGHHLKEETTWCLQILMLDLLRVGVLEADRWVRDQKCWQGYVCNGRTGHAAWARARKDSRSWQLGEEEGLGLGGGWGDLEGMSDVTAVRLL